VNVTLKQENGESEVECYDRLIKMELGNDVWDRDGTQKPSKWEPTEVEIEAWDKRVLELTQLIDLQAAAHDSECEKNNDENQTTTNDKKRVAKRQKTCNLNTNGFIQAGLNRNGAQIVKNYKESLPPFLKAAAEGNLNALKMTVNSCQVHDSNPTSGADYTKLKALIEIQDRNGSTAEHWAAGGGHLSCLKYLMELSHPPQQLGAKEEKMMVSRRRKRDGKTSLHYAARNGHDHIINYLLVAATKSNNSYAVETVLDVDTPSGDGTTPLHLACYSGHLHTIRLLIETHGANVCIANEWGCGVGHWIAMSINSDSREINRVMDYMKLNNSALTTFDTFGSPQKQGHTAIHKAAQKLNKNAVRWLAIEAAENWTDEQRKVAGASDCGGNNPSDIWSLMGGDDDFMEWMRTECNW